MVCVYLKPIGSYVTIYNTVVKSQTKTIQTFAIGQYGLYSTSLTDSLHLLQPLACHQPVLHTSFLQTIQLDKMEKNNIESVVAITSKTK